MPDGIDRWENEGGRFATQTLTAAAPRQHHHNGGNAMTPKLGAAERSPRKEPAVRRPDTAEPEPYLGDGGPAIQRLLFVADAAVADAGQLPPPVRAVIDTAAAVYVLTPTLPGRLAWLADDVDEVRHVADERLDAVLGHMHSIGAHASGVAARGSLMTVVADAVADFKPDHILLALRSAEHANWQERGLVKHLEQRFGLPVTSYAVDSRGHASSADGPLLLCFDGSENARRAIERAGALFAGRRALVVTVWQPIADLDGFAWTGATASPVDVVALNRAAAEDGAHVAEDGVRAALDAGLKAEAIAVEAAGSVWNTIVEVADRHDAAAIIMGSRGLTGVRSMLLGSVSSAVLHHADRPMLVIRQPVAGASPDAA
jgi:nucleotide-binding universal stress UspA family protein